MPWPQPVDFNAAMQNPQTCLRDEDLRTGEVATSMLGLPLVYTGSLAAVYKVTSPDQRVWAVKCFTQEVPTQRQRYDCISAYLQQVGLPFTVDFEYQEEGIRIGQGWYPILKMCWVEGILLNEFVKSQLGNQKLLSRLSSMWVQVAHDLRRSSLAHGDLQHGNVLLVPKREDRVSLRLIDYDGMYVPALAGKASGEVGHRNYQHPGRKADPFHPEVDRFSHLVIYTALRCASVTEKALWDRHSDEDKLLFREEDFTRPASSSLLKQLWSLSDRPVRALVGQMILASQRPAREVPLLESLVGKDRTPTLTTAEEREVRRLLAPSASVIPSPEPTDPEPGWWTDRVQEESKSGPEKGHALGRPVATAPPEPDPTPRPSDPDPSEKVPSPAPRLSPARRYALLAAGVLGLLAVGILLWSLMSSEPPFPPGTVVPLQTDPALLPLGESRTLTITIPPALRSLEKVTLAFHDLPEEVQVTPTVTALQTGQSEATLTLSLSSSAKLGTYPLKASFRDGEAAALAEATLEVQVTVPSVSIQPIGEVVNLRPGETRLVPIVVDRGAYTGDLAWTITSPARKDDLDLQILTRENQLMASLRAGSKTVFLQGQARIQAEIAGQPSGAPLALPYHVEARIDLSQAPSTGKEVLRPGEKARFPVLLDRHGYQGPIDLRVELTPPRNDLKVELVSDAEPAITVQAAIQARLGEGSIQVTPQIQGISVGDPLTLRYQLGADTRIVVDQRQLFLLPGLDRSVRFKLESEGSTDGMTVVARPHSLDSDQDIAVFADLRSGLVQVRAQPKARPGEGTITLGAYLRDRLLGTPLTLSYTILPGPFNIEPVRGIHFSPDGKRVVVVPDSQHLVSIWDTATGKNLLTLRGTGSRVYSAAFSPDGQTIVTGSNDRTVRLWDARTGKVLHTLTGHKGTVSCVTFSPDGKRIASGSADRGILVWDTSNGEVTATMRAWGNPFFEGHKRGITSVAFSPDGKSVASASYDGLVKIWNADTGRLTRSLPGHIGGTRAIRYSPDGTRLASTGSDRTVKLWKVADGEAIASLAGHAGEVVSLAFSPDGKQLVSGASIHVAPGPANPGAEQTEAFTGEIKLWDLDTLRALRGFEDPSGPMNGVAFSPDGRAILSATGNRQDETVEGLLGEGAPRRQSPHLRYWLLR